MFCTATDSVLICGAGGGIRTPVDFHPNGFQDRPVMAASVHRRIIFYVDLLIPASASSIPAESILSDDIRQIPPASSLIETLAASCAKTRLVFCVSASGFVSDERNRLASAAVSLKATQDDIQQLLPNFSGASIRSRTGNPGFAVRRLACLAMEAKVRLGGFEPATFGLRVRCSAS